MADMQGRKRRVSSGGSGVHKRGEGLNTGPVGRKEGYAGRPGISSGGNKYSGGGGRRSGGGGTLVLAVLIAIVLLGGGGGLSALLGGGSQGSGSQGTSSYSSSGSGSSYSSQSYGNSNYGYPGGSLYGNYNTGNSLNAFNQGNSGSSGSYGGTSSSSGSYAGAGSGGMLQSLLGALGSSSTNTLTGTYSGWDGNNNSGSLNTSTTGSALNRFTKLKGNGQDIVTIMVYICGTDLESRSSMATSDIVEMSRAATSDKVNVILYTGGCTKWNNNIISPKTNQIFQVKEGGLRCLVSDDGDRAMTDPATLTRFIKWCSKNFPANRNELIFWDHGGGSVSGYGYDQKHARSGAMSLPQIKSAVKDSGVTFDIIGFDACLMATAETALALSDSADYLLASEETEPGTGWYYTNWLNLLSQNTSIQTTELGRKIIDDFVDMSARQARGQSTTLSLVDLGELKETFPDSFSEFAGGINDLLDDRQFNTIATARKKTREFARSSHINQYDLVHLAKNLGTAEGNALANTVLSAVKYNRTSSDMTNSYGLAVYFPDKNKYTDTMSATYKALELDSSYADSFRKIASIQAAGQAVSGGSHSLYDLLGGASGSSSSGSVFDMYGGSLFGGSGSSGDAMMDLLGALLGGGRSLDRSYTTDFIGESGYTKEDLAEILGGNVFNPDQLRWSVADGNYVMTLPAPQWSLVNHVERNVFYDDGEGYIDLGLDTAYSVSDDGVLTAAADRYWISIDEHPVAFYHITTTASSEGSTTIGRVPCYLNGDRCDLILIFDEENPYGYVAGASFDYINGETDTEPKAITALKDGDTIDFVADYYTYDQEYVNSYLLDQMVVSGEPEITDTYIGDGIAFASYLFTDIYGDEYWSEPIWIS